MCVCGRVAFIFTSPFPVALCIRLVVLVLCNEPPARPIITLVNYIMLPCLCLNKKNPPGPLASFQHLYNKPSLTAFSFGGRFWNSQICTFLISLTVLAFAFYSDSLIHFTDRVIWNSHCIIPQPPPQFFYSLPWSTSVRPLPKPTGGWGSTIASRCTGEGFQI